MSWFWFVVAVAGWAMFWLETRAHALSRRKHDD